MKILVTGATGFLGTVLCRELQSRGHDVYPIHSKNHNLVQSDSLNSLDHLKFDQIFHLAAWTQAGDFCLYHPGEQWIINQSINTHLLSWWQSSQPQAKLISMGTSCAYDPNLPLSEDNYLKGEPIESLYTYAMTKRMLYLGQRSLAKQFGLRYLCVVPSTLYGPGYHTDGRQMHFIFDLIRKIIRGKKHSEPVILWGDGYQRRELVFVQDFVRLLLKLNDTVENELVNLGAGTEHSIRDFASMICREVGYDFNRIQFDLSRYSGAKSKCLDISKLTGMVGDLQLTPLEDGLRQTIQWFEKTGFAI